MTEFIIKGHLEGYKIIDGIIQLPEGVYIGKQANDALVASLRKFGCTKKVEDGKEDLLSLA